MSMLRIITKFFNPGNLKRPGLKRQKVKASVLRTKRKAKRGMAEASKRKNRKQS